MAVSGQDPVAALATTVPRSLPFVPGDCVVTTECVQGACRATSTILRVDANDPLDGEVKFPVLPNFVIAGTVRSGTTSIYHHLASHPDVYVSPIKEVHYFDRNYERGRDWYEAQFSQWNGQIAVGEATPNYVFHPQAVSRMCQTLPTARIIVILRNPVDRAYSQYWMQRSFGNETLSFEEAVRAEPTRLAGGDDRSRSAFGYLERSRYLWQLEGLAQHYPPQQVFVMLYESLRDEPAESYVELCRFLGIDAEFRPEHLGRATNVHRSFRSERLRDLNRRIAGRGYLSSSVRRLLGRVNTKGEGYPQLNPETRKRLLSEFSAHNALLASTLEKDLSIWSDEETRHEA